MSYNRGYETLSFNDSLKVEEERLNKNNEFDIINYSYISRSNYCSQIKKYTSLFKNSKFLYLNFDDLVDEDKKNNLIKKLFDFLGLDKIDNKENIHENKSSKPYYKFIQSLLYTNKFFKKISSFLITNNETKYWFKQQINNFNSKNIDDRRILKLDYNKLSSELIEWNNNEVINLQQLTNLDLKSWLIK